MTIYAATIVDTPGDPFAGDPAEALAEDSALLVRDGVIRARGSFAALRAAHPGEPVTRLDGGLLVPGFVDTHVHYPQIRAIASGECPAAASWAWNLVHLTLEPISPMPPSVWPARRAASQRAKSSA